MSKHFNIDIDDIIQQHKSQFENSKQNFFEEYNKMIENQLLEYEKIAKDHSNKLKSLLDVNEEIHKSHDTLVHKSDQLKCEQQQFQTENDRLECISSEYQSLRAQEIELNDAINKTKIQLSEVKKDKNIIMKKLKREINAFKEGVNMYEQFLQLSMNIDNKEKKEIINITMKNLNNHSDYNISFENNDNNIKLLDIIPRSQSILKAAALYNQNKDIQGLLAFLYSTKE